MTTIPQVSSDSLRSELQSQPGGWFLIDVRTPGEFRGGHIEGAVNHPVDAITPESVRELAGEAGERKICFICQSGKRSQRALEVCQSAGLEGAVELAGGMNEWPSEAVTKESGGPISLFRQVQIAAGSLVLFGVILGAAVHPGFYFLSGFVGAGLVFAGVSGTCGMGVLLSKMPWNQ